MMMCWIVQIQCKVSVRWVPSSKFLSIKWYQKIHGVNFLRPNIFISTKSRQRYIPLKNKNKIPNNSTTAWQTYLLIIGTWNYKNNQTLGKLNSLLSGISWFTTFWFQFWTRDCRKDERQKNTEQTCVAHVVSTLLKTFNAVITYLH